jgi:hypothetical protein
MGKCSLSNLPRGGGHQASVPYASTVLSTTQRGTNLDSSSTDLDSSSSSSSFAPSPGGPPPPAPPYILAYHPRPGGADVPVSRITLQEYRSQWPYPPQKKRTPRVQYLELTLLGTVGGPCSYAPEEQGGVLRPRVPPDVAGYHFVFRRGCKKEIRNGCAVS